MRAVILAVQKLFYIVTNNIFALARYWQVSDYDIAYRFVPARLR